MTLFDGVNFAVLSVHKLEAGNLPSHEGFRPLRPEFSTYWKKGRVRRECASSIASCWYLAVEGRLAAYITLLADRLVVESELLSSEDVRYRTFPAVKIGLLAADRRARGAGTALVRWAFRHVVETVCPRLGARFITVDALYDPDSSYDVAPYYERFGFIHAAPDARARPGEFFRTMFFDLKPLIDAASGKPA